jgi:mRNA interferase RelE/StbE
VTLAVVYRQTAYPGLARIRDEDKASFTRVRRAIRALAEEPHPDGAAPWGRSGYYRLHAGPVRILYEVDEANACIYVVHVAVTA